MKKYFFSLTICLLILSPVFVSAQGFGGAQEELEKAGKAAYGEGVTETSLESVVGNIINIALSITGIIFLVLMVYAGYLWMTAGGSTEQVDNAKKIIKASIIGIIIVFLSYGITFFVINSLLNNSSS